MLPRTHVFIVDGTLSQLEPGRETNAGLLYKLLLTTGARRGQTVAYNPGVQGRYAAKWVAAAAGIGITLSIAQGYAVLSRRFRPGDRIMLFGFSRGGYAVRCLAGMIGRLGLLRRECVSDWHVTQALHFYQLDDLGPHGRLFRRTHCRGDVPVEFIGVWDTVKALGVPYPGFSRLAPMAAHFHDELLLSNVRHAYHALALDEDRSAFTPLPWRLGPARREGRVEQMWFPGAHGDVGGQVWTRPEARPLANIPLVWMIERALRSGLDAPSDWRRFFPTDAAAPAKGTRSGSARLFWDRRPRSIGLCASEAIHTSVYERIDRLRDYRPLALTQDGDAIQMAPLFG